MKLHILLVLTVSCSFAHSCSARTLIGIHPGMQWLQLSPDGRWLDAGSASSEGSSSKDSDTWRYDIHRGGYINLGYKFEYTWLSNSLIADVAGTETENSKAAMGLQELAPVISLSRPSATKLLHIYRDQVLARDPYNDVRLSQNKRQLLVYSRYWIRRFDIRTGRLLSRTKWPITSSPYSNDGRNYISPDGRWIITIRSQSSLPNPNGQEQEPKRLIQLHDQQGHVTRNFPQREGNSLIMTWSSDNVWITPTIFALTRDLSPKNKPGKPRTFTEFYDARTLKRLWVLSNGAVRERVDDPAGPPPYFYYYWQPYYVIPQNDQIIVCGKNIWTWRDARTGKIVRQALRPTAWTPDQTLGHNIDVHGDFYYWFDSKGRIWRDSFQFSPSRSSALK